MPARERLRQCGRDEPRDFRKAVCCHALVGVTDVRIGEAVEHGVAVGGQVDGAGLIGRETRDDIVGHVVVRHAVDGRHGTAFVNRVQPQQRAGPGDAAMAGVEHANLCFFVRQHRRDELDAHTFERWPPGTEIVFHHPLRKGFGHHGAAVLPAGLCGHAFAQGVGRAWRDAIDHRVRRAGMCVEPCNEAAVAWFAAQREELAQAAAEALAVVAQVVAIEQREWRAATLQAQVQQTGQRAV
jgi:hypothetical protein